METPELNIRKMVEQSNNTFYQRSSVIDTKTGEVVLKENGQPDIKDELLYINNTALIPGMAQELAEKNMAFKKMAEENDFPTYIMVTIITK